MTKFDNGKGEGVECGLGQDHHVIVHNEVVLGSLAVGIVQLNEGLSQQQGPSVKGTRRARVSKRPKILTNEAGPCPWVERVLS